MAPASGRLSRLLARFGAGLNCNGQGAANTESQRQEGPAVIQRIAAMTASVKPAVVPLPPTSGVVCFPPA